MSLFAFGGACYGLIEIMWRGRTHFSMLVTGGACFTVLFKIYNRVKLSLPKKCAVGGAVITVSEFITGCLFNKKLKVWDYSSRPFNIKGQICPLYSFLWAMLCVPISLAVKYLSYPHRLRISARYRR